jgi:hypothetical protein
MQLYKTSYKKMLPNIYDQELYALWKINLDNIIHAKNLSW